MKIEEIRTGNRTEYVSICTCCGLSCNVLTQDDNFPEYETEVYVQCSCGEYIEFILPVN